MRGGDLAEVQGSKLPPYLAAAFAHGSCSPWTDDREELDWQSMQD